MSKASESEKRRTLIGLFACQSVSSNRNSIRNDSLWIGEAYVELEPITLALITPKQIENRLFKNANATDGTKRSVRFLASSESGKLWAMDQRNNVLLFNPKNATYTVQATVSMAGNQFINGLAVVDEHKFIISTQSQLLFYNLNTKKTTDLTSQLPTASILCAVKDPANPNLLWIGTLADGLISYDIESGRATSYSTLNGLPNNTIYAIIPQGKNQLWCSSNKGIFAFGKDTKMVRSFTSVDGLPNDEFNKFEYMALPQGLIAFGGSIGYTLFNPLKITADSFNPHVVITGIAVTNTTLLQPLQTIKRLNLKHHQNFIDITFAATQFDIPQKLKYRY